MNKIHAIQGGQPYLQKQITVWHGYVNMLSLKTKEDNEEM